MKKRYVLRWSLALLILLAVAGFFIVGLYRLQFSTDMLAALPQNDPVLADARYVLMHNPAIEKIVIDISIARQDVPLLTDCAAFVEEEVSFTEKTPHQANKAEKHKSDKAVKYRNRSWYPHGRTDQEKHG